MGCPVGACLVDPVPTRQETTEGQRPLEVCKQGHLLRDLLGSRQTRPQIQRVWIYDHPHGTYGR